MTRCLLIVLLLAGLSAAQEQPPVTDTLQQPADTAPKRAGKTDRYPLKSPGTAVLLSLLLPGGGQVYTHGYWKAALIAPAEVTLGYLAVREHLAANDASRANDTTAYERHRDRRTTFLWWTGAVVAFSMADAYVSAQMYGFEREMRFTLGPRRAGLSMGI